MAKRLNGAKLVVTVESNKKTKQIKTMSVFDNRINRDTTEEVLKSAPSVARFSDLDDMKESLNWCLAGDSSKYKVKFGQGNKDTQTGYVYIFD